MPEFNLQTAVVLAVWALVGGVVLKVSCGLCGVQSPGLIPAAGITVLVLASCVAAFVAMSVGVEALFQSGGAGRRDSANLGILTFGLALSALIAAGWYVALLRVGLGKALLLGVVQLVVLAVVGVAVTVALNALGGRGVRQAFDLVAVPASRPGK